MHQKFKKKKAIFFDFDNTLADWDAADVYVNKKIAAYVKKIWNIPPQVFLAEIEQVHHGIKGKVFNDTYDRFFWFKTIFSHLHLSITEKQLCAVYTLYWKTVYKNLKLFPHAQEMLLRAKKKYYLVLVTDSDGKNDSTKYGKLKATKIVRFFDCIVTSNMVKASKPSLKLWKYALRKLHVSAKESTMVGDKPLTDLLPAKKLGMHTILMRKVAERSKEPLHYHDFVDRIITDLSEIV